MMTIRLQEHLAGGEYRGVDRVAWRGVPQLPSCVSVGLQDQ